MNATTPFPSIKTAKDYLAEKIVAEAKRQGAPLSDVERKMLYFSEEDQLCASMRAVSNAFDRDYNQDEFEQKIAGLVRALKASQSPEEQEKWDEAVLKLCDGDHYLLVLIDGASRQTGRWKLGRFDSWLPTFDRPVHRNPGDLLKLTLMTLAFIILIFLVVIAKDHFE